MVKTCLPIQETQETWTKSPCSFNWTTFPLSVGTLYCLCLKSKFFNLVFKVSELSRFSCVWLFVTLWSVASQVLCPWNTPDKNTRVGCHALLQGIFLSQGSNLCLLHWQEDSLLLRHQGNLVTSMPDVKGSLTDLGGIRTSSCLRRPLLSFWESTWSSL